MKGGRRVCAVAGRGVLASFLHMQRTPEARPALAVSLSSAFLGFHSHAGFLQGLAEGGVWPAHIAGASSGALVAALAATGMNPRAIFDLLQTQRFRWSFFEWGMLTGSAFLPIHRRRHSGGLQGRAILAYLRELFGDRRIEDCDLGLGIAVTNLTTQRAEVRTAGPLAELVVASCACPGVISHQIVDDQALWDGGIAQSPPFSHWTDHAVIERVLVHEVGRVDVPPASQISMFPAFALAHDVVVAELQRLRREKLTAAGKQLEILRTPSSRPPLIVSKRTGARNFELGRVTGLRASQLPLFSVAQLAA